MQLLVYISKTLKFSVATLSKIVIINMYIVIRETNIWEQL